MKISASTILVVDDDEEIVIQAHRILENLGTTVLAAHDVAGALKILEQQTPHLIITDINMIPLTGFDLLGKLKNHERLSEVPVIAMSALNDKDSVYRAIYGGVSDYLIKPLKTTYFIRKVRRALKDQEFLRYEFPQDQAPQVDLSLRGNIHSVGDIGVRVESNACLNTCASISLKAPRPEIPEFSAARFAIHNRGYSHHKGMFLNELIGVPVGTEFLSLRRALAK